MGPSSFVSEGNASRLLRVTHDTKIKFKGATKQFPMEAQKSRRILEGIMCAVPLAAWMVYVAARIDQNAPLPSPAGNGRFPAKHVQ